MQLPSKDKHSPCFSVLLDYGCFYLGFCRKKGLHGHYVCTESRWPSITCYLGKQSWAAWELHLGSKGCSNFSPPSRWQCRGAVAESQLCPRTQPPGASAVCAAQQLELPAEQTQSWATGQKLFPVHTAPCFQTLMGLHTFPIFFFSRELAFPCTAANKSEPDTCLEWLLQDVAPEQCLQQMCLFSIADGTLMGWGKVVGR